MAQNRECEYALAHKSQSSHVPSSSHKFPPSQVSSEIWNSSVTSPILTLTSVLWFQAQARGVCGRGYLSKLLRLDTENWKLRTGLDQIREIYKAHDLRVNLTYICDVKKSAALFNVVVYLFYNTYVVCL